MDISNYSGAEIEEGLRLLALERQKEAEKIEFEILQESFIYRLANESKQCWKQIGEYKHFDVFRSIIISIIFAVLSYHLPLVILKYFKNFSIEFADNLIRVQLVLFKFYIELAIVDVTLYLYNPIIYKYLKRNGNNKFDFNESIINLTEWQKTLLTISVYFGYLFLIAIQF